jgi:hypothetical protein
LNPCASRGGLLLADASLRADVRTKEVIVKMQLRKTNERLSGRVLVPALLYMAGVPFGIVLLLWFFFFRG